MALIPYEGMELELPTGEDWVVIFSREDYAALCTAQYHLNDGVKVLNKPSWLPIFKQTSDWDYEYSSNGGESFIQMHWDEQSIGSLIGVLSTCNRAVDSIVNYTSYRQGFGVTHMETASGLIMNGLDRNITTAATPLPTCPEVLCNNLSCKKVGEYYWLTFDQQDILKLHQRFFFYDNGVPDSAVTYRVRPAWKSLIDPNDGAGESSSGGGNGNHDDTSDRIDISPMPTISAAEAGVITIFRPSLTQLQGLNNYLWTNVADFIENVQKFFSNPIDYIIAFNIFPINPNVKAERNIKLGLWETTVKMPPVTTQWYGESCGKIYIPEYWGSALDYAPYTKISCMLPFIGSVQLNTDEVMGKELEIIYRFDLLSGSCVAFILVNGSVFYQFTGECAVSIPLTGADWSRVYSAAIGAIGTALSGGLSAGASGAIAQAGFQSSNMLAAKQGIQAAKQFEKLRDSMPKGTRGRPALLDAAKSARETAINAANSGNVGNAIRASRIISTVNNSVGSVMNGKISIQHSGTISGTSGLLGMRRPFVTIEYPNQSLAENYKHFVGYPSNIFAKLSDVSGYTECEQVIVENFPGTDNEYAEMLEALKGGVYL